MTDLNNNKLKVGIVGFGVVGKKRYHFLQENPHFETVAVSDKRFAIKSFLKDSFKLISNNDVRIYHDYIDLFEQDLDVLFVSVPNYLAPDATIRGLQNGNHVFCEKPLSINYDQGKELIELAKSKNLYMYLSDSTFCPLGIYKFIILTLLISVIRILL